jgi:hypothetical protein
VLTLGSESISDGVFRVVNDTSPAPDVARKAAALTKPEVFTQSRKAAKKKTRTQRILSNA